MCRRRRARSGAGRQEWSAGGASLVSADQVASVPPVITLRRYGLRLIPVRSAATKKQVDRCRHVRLERRATERRADDSLVARRCNDKIDKGSSSAFGLAVQWQPSDRVP